MITGSWNAWVRGGIGYLLTSHFPLIVLVPPNGLVVYCGTIVTDDGKEKKVNIDFEPFKPINTSLYLCDNKFHTEVSMLGVFSCIFRWQVQSISTENLVLEIWATSTNNYETWGSDPPPWISLTCILRNPLHFGDKDFFFCSFLFFYPLVRTKKEKTNYRRWRVLLTVIQTVIDKYQPNDFQSHPLYTLLKNY